MNYTKQDNQDFALKLVLMLALDIKQDRLTNERLKDIIKFLSDRD